MQLKRKLTWGDWLIIAANLVPVIGVWFFGWSAVEVFIVYVLETLLVGILTVLKLLVVTFHKGSDTWYNKGTSTAVSGLFFILFFIVHFGMFAAIQTTIFSQVAGIIPPNKGAMYFFFNWHEFINKEILIMLAVMAVSYLARVFVPFVMNGEYKTDSMMKIMFQPYGRIFIQQFTVILGSMFLSFGFGKGFILVFALAKIFFEVMVNFESILNKTIKEMEEQNPPKVN